VLIVVQILNGVLLPVLLYFIVRLAGNHEIMGKHATGPVYRTLAWLSLIVITIAVALMLVTLFVG
jgi:Mn2+/Fe2+ NRAMP family transporter